MMQLIIVVLAIALGALFVAGGISYFSSSTASRIEMSRALQTQMDVVSSAMASYRFANNGFLPSGVFSSPDLNPDTNADEMKARSLLKYMPNGQMPGRFKFPMPFEWSIYKKDDGAFEGICIRVLEDLGRGADQGFVSFAKDMSRSGEVFFGTTGKCPEALDKVRENTNLPVGKDLTIVIKDI